MYGLDTCATIVFEFNRSCLQAPDAAVAIVYAVPEFIWEISVYLHLIVDHFHVGHLGQTGSREPGDRTGIRLFVKEMGRKL
jgi:hypothetical protein